MSKKNKNTLVAGATGFLGLRVCKELFKNGHTVVALSNDSGNISSINDFIAHFITADLLNPNHIEKIIEEIKFRNISTIISLIGSVDYKEDYESSYLKNVKTSQSIVDIALHLHSIKILHKLVFIGSVTSRGFTKKSPKQNKILTESKSYYKKNLSVYSDVKHEAEKLVEDAIKEFNLPACIVEPGSLVGKEIESTSTTNIGLIKKILKGIPILSGGASYTSADKAAEGIVKILQNGTVGETYLLGGENMSMKEFARLVRKIYLKNFPLEKKPVLPIFTIPKILALLLGKLNLIINSQQALLGNTFHYIDFSKAEKETGYSHTRGDLEEEILAILESIEENN